MKQSTFLPTHLVLLLALAWAPTYTKKQAKDYNGTIFTKQGITLTPSSIYYNGPLQAITSPQLAGYLDQTFNATGTVVIPSFAGGNFDQCNALQLQPDGKLVLAGYSRIPGGATCYSAVRLNSNGSLDTSFGNRGTVVVPTFGGSNIDQCSDLQLQPDGKLVLAGYSFTGGAYCYSAVRLNSNGSLDTSFGNGGTVMVPTFGGSNINTSYALQLQPDGKLVLAGYNYTGGVYCYSAVRLNSNGSLDNSFGNGGTVVVPTFGGANEDRCFTLQLQPDGKLVLAGYSQIAGGTISYSAIRLNSNGSLDNSFGNGGTVVVPTFGGGNDDECYALELQPDGKLVLAGCSFTGVGWCYSTVRLNSNGSLDASFGNSGMVVVPTFGGDNDDECGTLQMQPDGKLVLAGYSQIAGGGTCYSAVRLTNQTPTLQDYQTVYPGQGGFY